MDVHQGRFITVRLLSRMKLLLVLACLVVAASARRTFFGDQVYRITIENEEDLEVLKSLQEKYELDMWREVREFGGSADVRIKKIDLPAIRIALGMSRINYEIFIEDVEELMRGERSLSSADTRNPSSFEYDVYHKFEEIQQWIYDMAVEYPDLVTKSLVGTSHEGRHFYAITVGTNSNNPNFVLNCGIHAREWVTPATCMWSANVLVQGYNDDATIRNRLNNVNFVFIPSSNPDGYAFTWSNDRMWRKTRTKHGICRGVDPNRNFDANHCGEGSSTSPCSDLYCGPEAFSEPCTAAQRDFVKGLGNVKMYVDIHAYYQYWMYPYGYKLLPAADRDVMHQIAADSVAAIKGVHGMTYTYGSISNVIYVASGSSADYFYETENIKCTFATELRDEGKYGFLLPANQIVPTAEESLAAFLVMAEAVADGTC